MRLTLLSTFLLFISVGFAQHAQLPIKQRDINLKSHEVFNRHNVIRPQSQHEVSRRVDVKQLGVPGATGPGKAAEPTTYLKRDENRVYRGGTPDSCMGDTVEYLYSKASQVEWYYMADAYIVVPAGSDHDHYSRYAQYYDAPQTINVSGACFYGYVYNTEAGTDTADVVVTLYTATADSFPDQILAQKTVTVDDTYSGVDLDVMKYCVEFDSNTVVSAPYLVGISTTTTDSLTVASNSFTNGDGVGEGLGFTYYSNPSFPGFEGWYDQILFTAVWDFDWLIEPIVDYELDAYLSLDTDTICQNDSICATVTTDPIYWNRMYNQNYPNNPLGMTVDYDWGDLVFESDTAFSKCHVYSFVPSSDMTIAVDVQLTPWTGFGCIGYNSQDIHVDYQPVASFNYVDNLGTTISFSSMAQYADSIMWDLGVTTTTDSAFTYQFGNHDTAWVTLYAYNNCGVDSMTQAIVPDPTSIEEFNLSSLVSVYPNPASERITVNVNHTDQMRLEVLNVLGDVVVSERIRGRSVVDLAHVSRGCYFVRVSTDSQATTKRIVLH